MYCYSDKFNVIANLSREILIWKIYFVAHKSFISNTKDMFISLVLDPRKYIRISVFLEVITVIIFTPVKITLANKGIKLHG